MDIACILKDQGQYRRALQLFYHARDIYQTEYLSLDANHVSREIVGCYLLLNRLREARDLGLDVIARYQALGEDYSEALVLLDLATAEADLGDLDAAQSALDMAEPIFATLEAYGWVADTRLRRAKLALRRGNAADALARVNEVLS